MIDQLCQSDYRLCFSQPIPTTSWASAGLSKFLATVANETEIFLATDKTN